MLPMTGGMEADLLKADEIHYVRGRSLPRRWRRGGIGPELVVFDPRRRNPQHIDGSNKPRYARDGVSFVA